MFYNGRVFLKLLLIFIFVPLLELVIIIEMASRVGLGWTVLSLLAVSAAGAALARSQGRGAFSRIRRDVREGVMPADPLIDGALVLAGALLLLTPGYLTDAAGLLILLPPVRRPLRSLVRRNIRTTVEKRVAGIYRAGAFGGGAGAGRSGPGGGRSGPGTYEGGAGGGGAGAGGEPDQRRRELTG